MRYALRMRRKINSIIEFIRDSGGEKAKMPRDIKPMLSFPIDEPFDGSGWLFEIKWDGYRAIAEIQGGEVRLYSRNLRLFNDRFPKIINSLSGVKESAVFDGEAVMVDEYGVSNFQALQNYFSSGISGGNKLVYYIFDILYFSGYDLRGLPLIKRKNILEKIIPAAGNLKRSGYILEKGKKFAEIAADLGLEGIMAKKIDSRYKQGERVKDWLKIKFPKREEAIICGFTEPVQGRKIFGSLILGQYKNGELEYIGNVGSGFDEKSIQDIRLKMEPFIVGKPPFKHPPALRAPKVWVKPKIKCRVKFTEWTKDGRLRQPVFLGLVGEEPSLTHPFDKLKAGSYNGGESNAVFNKKNSIKITIDGEAQIISNINKKYFVEYTKMDLIRYYKKISPYILPYLKDRLQSLHRHPDGIYGENFYQKNIKGLVPDWIETVEIYSESQQERITYMLCQDEKALIYLANLGCIEINVWNARIPKNIRGNFDSLSLKEKKMLDEALDRPDYFIFDLDPLETEFDNAVKTALVIHEILEKLKVKNFCKTSGATGLHIYVPMGAKYTCEQAEKFGKIINFLVFNKLPKITSMERNPEKRKGKVYLDIGQNKRAQTMAAPYSLRPRPGAPVSAPLYWDEVKQGLNPLDYNIANMAKRLSKIGDIWKDVLGEGVDMKEAIGRIEGEGVVSG